MDCLRPTQGERILDIGSGPGFLVNDIARLVGSTGEVHGVDMADNMVNAARDLCAELPWVCFDVGDAMHLNYADNEFDAVCTTKVYEYVPHLDAAVAESARVLRPGGRGVILDSDWAAPYWSATDTVLRDRIIAAWSEHCAQQEVPMRLAASIRRAGLSLGRVVALPLVNVASEPDCFSLLGRQDHRGLRDRSQRLDGSRGQALARGSGLISAKGVTSFASTATCSRSARVEQRAPAGRGPSLLWTSGGTCRRRVSCQSSATRATKVDEGASRCAPCC